MFIYTLNSILLYVIIRKYKRRGYIMSDINNDSGLPEQEQPTNQYSEAEDGSTYWESNEVQNSFEERVQQPFDNNTDLNQKVHDPTYDESNSSQYVVEQKKKSGIKPFIVAVIVVVLLLATAATAYAFSDTLRNSIDLLLKSPKDYYANVENKSLGRSVDKSIAFMNLNKADKNIAQSLTTTLSYDKDTVGALLQTYAGMTISDLEALIGIPLDSLGFDMIAAENGNEGYQKFSVNLNSTDIISAELYSDLALKQVLYHIPELSPAYLKQSLDMSLYGAENIDYEKLTDAIKNFASDSTGDFYKRYMRIITNEIDDVELKKKDKLTVGDITVEANLLTVTIHPQTLTNIALKILEEAKNDEYLLDFLPLFDMTKEEYSNAIDKSLEELKNSSDYLAHENEFIKMHVYVGDDGDILGRNIEFIGDSGESVKLNYSHIEQNKKGAYDLYFNNNQEDSTIHVTGSHSIDDGAYTGAGKLNINSSDSGNVELDFDYNGIKTEIKNNRVYVYGDISLSSYAMMGMEIALEFDVKDDAQLSTLKLNMGKSSLVTLDMSTKYLKDFTIPKPDQNAITYDLLTDMDGYVSTIDIEGYISALSDRLGVDLQSLLGNFLPMY